MAIIRKNIEKGLACGSNQFISKLGKVVSRSSQFRPQGRPRRDEKRNKGSVPFIIGLKSNRFKNRLDLLVISDRDYVSLQDNRHNVDGRSRLQSQSSSMGFYEKVFWLLL